jgi:hypothetical protein
MKKLLLLSGSLLALTSCDPTQACSYLDVLGPYIPADILAQLQSLCDLIG